MSCAPARLPSHSVRLEGASSGQRHGVRAYGAHGRALPSVSMNAQHGRGYRARYGARASACRRASPSVSVNVTPTSNPTPSLHAVQGENPPCTAYLRVFCARPSRPSPYGALRGLDGRGCRIHLKVQLTEIRWFHRLRRQS